MLLNYLDSMSGTVLGLYNVMSGGAFAEATVFALGVQPYINSSIIIQLLTIAIPALERLARDGGEAGKKKIASITRYATVAIALLQGFGYYMICKNYNILEQQGIWPALVIIVSFVAGSSFVMWLMRRSASLTWTIRTTIASPRLTSLPRFSTRSPFSAPSTSASWPSAR